VLLLLLLTKAYYLLADVSNCLPHPSCSEMNELTSFNRWLPLVALTMVFNISGRGFQYLRVALSCIGHSLQSVLKLESGSRLYGIVFTFGVRLCIDHGLQYLWTCFNTSEWLSAIFLLLDGLFCSVSSFLIPSIRRLSFSGFPSGEHGCMALFSPPAFACSLTMVWTWSSMLQSGS